MFNKEFLKTLTIMYVEDDKYIRDSLGMILKKVFKEVIICVDGQDGLNEFKIRKSSTEPDVDAIISDINMPKLSGLNMLTAIREIDEDVPVALTTAHGESGYLMEAIKIQVAYYALKPINTPELLKNIQKICLVNHHKKLVEQKEQKLSSYMNIIDNVATIIKIDKDNKFIEVNDLFCEVSGYTMDELKEQDVSFIAHADILTTVHKNMMDTLQEGKTWEGTYKCSTKEDNALYLKISAIPEYDDMTQELIDFMLIGFIATDDEQDKRETMGKVRQNIIEEKKKQIELKKTIQGLESKLAMNSGVQDVGFIKDTLAKEKTKNLKLVGQIRYYEKDINALNNKLDNIRETEDKKRSDLAERYKEEQNKNKQLETKLIHIQNELNKFKPKK